MTHPEAMRAAIAAGRSVTVVGTGVTAALATNTAICSWPGLLEAGLEYVRSNKLLTSGTRLAAIQNDIEIGREEDGDYLLTAADKVVKALGGKASTNYTQFFGQSVGRLSLKPAESSKMLATAIGNLGPRLITTNYDTVLNSALGRHGVTWTDRNAFRRVISGESNDVAHLHGIWSNPASVILTSQDYASLLANDFVSSLKAAFGSLSTVLFIGFGAGLLDPTFGSFRSWLKSVMPGSTVHYQLCKSDELAAIAQYDTADPILGVSYGDTYEDLAPFLASLVEVHSVLTQDPRAKNAKPSAHVVQIAAVAKRQLLDKLTDTSVIAAQRRMIDITDTQLSDFVMEPILLPIPPDAFASEQEKAHPKVTRLNATEEAHKDQSIVLIGDEHSGVTTALMWMAIQRCQYNGAIPVYLDYLSLPQGPHPVAGAVRKYLRAAGGLSDSDDLPANIALVVDNVGAGGRTSIERVVRDAIALKLSFIVLGCHTGCELDIQQEFTTAGMSCSPTYLGRVSTRHAVDLARRVDPAQAEEIARRALEVAQRERLVRTPLSVTLLIIGISNNESWVSAVSNTSFLDSFVESLLGRGDPTVDARLQIDSAGYSLVLQLLAERFIDLDLAAVERLRLIGYIGEFLTRLDWEDRPEDVLRSLVAKGLLVDRDSTVRFRQSAYLHIFAAKRASNEGAFLQRLMQRPLRYSSAIRHYAALRRNDTTLLRWAYDLLKPADDLPTPSEGVFAVRASEDIAHAADRLEALAQSLEVSDSDLDSGADSDVDSSDDAHDWDPYDSMSDDVDKEPFPSANVESAPLQVRITGLISLVSNIIRDSEMVEDPELKEIVLARALRVWGQFVGILSTSLLPLIEQLVDVISDRLEMPQAEIDEFAEWMKRAWPFYAGMTGISDELATIKLARALSRLTAGAPGEAPVHSALMASMLQFDLNTPGWEVGLRGLWEAHGETDIVRTTTLVLARHAYVRSSDPRLGPYLEDLIIDVRCADVQKMGRSDRSVRERLRGSLRKERAVVKQREIAASKRAIALKAGSDTTGTTAAAGERGA